MYTLGVDDGVLNGSDEAVVFVWFFHYFMFGGIHV